MGQTTGLLVRVSLRGGHACDVAHRASRELFKQTPLVLFVGAASASFVAHTGSSTEGQGESDVACAACTRAAVRVFCGGEHTLLRHPDTLEVFQLGACGLGFNHDDPDLASQPAAYIKKVPLDGPALSVFAGYYHNMLRLRGGRCFSYGCGRQSPNDGQLFNGSLAEETMPVSTHDAFVEAALGGHHTVVRTRHGEVWTCGAGWQGQMGNGSLQYKNPIPSHISGLPRAQRISGGYYHNAALSEDGDWYVWGCNESSQLGASGIAQITEPRKLTDLSPQFIGKKVLQFGGGYVHSVLLLADGTVFTLGGHTEGQRALDPEIDEPPLVNEVLGLPAPASAIAVGNHHTLVVVEGRLFAFGSDEYGQVLGRGSPHENADHRVYQPREVVGLPSDDPVVHVAAGICHSAAQTASGRVFLWGCGSNGQTGNTNLAESSRVGEVDVAEIAKL